MAALLALALVTVPASAQQNSLRNQLVGSWNFVVAEVVAPDGKKSFPFEETPRGILIFTADGQFAQIHVASDVPKIASNNRLTGTPEEYATIMRRSISSFGTYSVNEEKKTVIFYIVSSTYPNFAGEAQERTIDKLTADEFINTNPNVAGAVARQISIRKRRETQRGLARRAPYIASYDGLFRLFVDKRDARLALFSSACLYDA